MAYIHRMYGNAKSQESISDACVSLRAVKFKRKI
jgi:hypothetical protein